MMKTKTRNIIAGIIIVLTASCQLLYAQKVTFSADVESTITGLQWGGTAGYTGARSWRLGAFYLRSKDQAEVWPSPGKMQLYGVYVSAPLVRTEKIVFSAHVRAGLTNQQFVVVIPGAETQINITRHIASLVNVSWRYGHAALGTSLMFSF